MILNFCSLQPVSKRHLLPAATLCGFFYCSLYFALDRVKNALRRSYSVTSALHGKTLETIPLFQG